MELFNSRVFYERQTRIPRPVGGVIYLGNDILKSVLKKT
jgi:hypothetical protein